MHQNFLYWASITIIVTFNSATIANIVALIALLSRFFKILKNP